MFTAMVVATFGLLRTSEFTAVNQSVRYSKRKTDMNSFKALYISNLSAEYDCDNHVKWYKLLINASKTDIFRQTVTIIIGKGKEPVCPVVLLHKMLKKRVKLAKNNPRLKVHKAAPLFIAENGKIVSRANMSLFLKTCLTAVGLDTRNFSLYSFRIGGATMYAKRGFNDYDIQLLGRWQSAAYQTYIRKSEADIAAMSQLMAYTPICDPNATFLFQNVAQKDLLCHPK